VTPQVFLTIETRSKAIPYPAASNADSQNFGFKPLKGKPDKIAKIQEAKGMPGIVKLLQALNAKDSPFFSVGCEKYIGDYHDGLFYVRGYVEFAFNYGPLLRDIQYMSLFKGFTDYVAKNPLSKGWSVNWDLQPAHFTSAKIDGYSCCLWLHVRSYLTHHEAVTNYNQLAEYQVGFFDSIGVPNKVELKPIY
jgi:hypothetical protein